MGEKNLTQEIRAFLAENPTKELVEQRLKKLSDKSCITCEGCESITACAITSRELLGTYLEKLPSPT